VREVAQLGGSIKGLVPELVEQNVKGKLDPAYKLAEFAVPEEKSESRKSKVRKKS
jgi:hypothetical protein